MAATELKVTTSNSNMVKLAFNTVGAQPYASAVLAVDAELDTKFGKTDQYWAKMKLDDAGPDYKVLILISDTDAATCKICAGNGYAAADADLPVLAAAGAKAVCLESAKYAYDGYIYIYSSVATNIGVIVMP
jgi:hypothetical protein